MVRRRRRRRRHRRRRIGMPARLLVPRLAAAARMVLGAAAEERFISVLFNSPAAPSFMHVTTLP